MFVVVGINFLNRGPVNLNCLTGFLRFGRMEQKYSYSKPL